MRLRKLGFGQSLIFVAPPEVDRSIREMNSRAADAIIETRDIVKWSIEETCRTVEVDIKHWASQGLSYEVRQDAWDQYSGCESKTESTVQALRDGILEREAQTLEEMYGIGHRSLSSNISPDVRERRRDIARIQSWCEKLGIEMDSLKENRVREEQERELAHEEECEQQVERPPKTEPLKHRVHRRVKEFVDSGEITSMDTAFLPAFQCLQELGIAKECNTNIWTKRLLVTKDYMQTVVRVFADNAGDFLRPVNWIVSSTRSGEHTLVVMSPYEVNELLPSIRSSSAVHLHLYSPRVKKSMRSLDDLCLHCIPPLLLNWRVPEDTRRQLNIFAGQLYLRDNEEYRGLCNFLGLYINSKETPVKHGVEFHSDGFIKPRYRLAYPTSPFLASPVPFLKSHLAICQRGQDFFLSHLGKIAHAKILTENDFRR